MAVYQTSSQWAGGSRYITHLTLRLTQTMEKQTITGLPCWPIPWVHLGGPIHIQLQRPHQFVMLILYRLDSHPSFLPHSLPPFLMHICLGHSSPDWKGCKNVAASPNAARSQWNRPYKLGNNQAASSPLPFCCTSHCFILTEMWVLLSPRGLCMYQFNV